MLYVHDAEDATRALTAVYSLREQTEGAIAVLMWGKEVPALRIACGRWGVEYVSIMDAAKARGDVLLRGSVNGEPAGFAREEARLLATAYSPFAQTVMVGTESRMPQLAKWWAVIWKCRAQCVADATGNTLGFAQKNIAFRRWQARLRKSQKGVIRSLLSTEAELRKAERIAATKTALLVTPQAEWALIEANPAHVWWPENCTVVTAVMPEDMETLEANWRSVRWPVEIGRRIVEVGEDGTLAMGSAPLGASPLGAASKTRSANQFAASPMVGRHPEGLRPRVPIPFAEQPYWIQAIIAAAAQCKTKRLLYLDPCMRPVPGAELFYREVDQGAAYASAGWCFVRRGRKVLETPKLGPPATLFDVAFLKRAAKAFAKEKKERNFEVFLHAFAKKEKRTVTVQDVMPCGWNR